MLIKILEVEKQVQKLKNKLIDEITDLIRALPDNPNIHRMSNNCFLISSKRLPIENWTPEYSDFRRQYDKIICYIIEQESLEKIIYLFEKIIEDGKYAFKFKEVMRFHPIVINNLKNLLQYDIYIKEKEK